MGLLSIKTTVSMCTEKRLTPSAAQSKQRRHNKVHLTTLPDPNHTAQLPSEQTPLLLPIQFYREHKENPALLRHSSYVGASCQENTNL